MALFSIAGLVVEMTPVHPLTASRAKRYAIANGEAQLAVVGGGTDGFEEHALLAQSFYEQLPAFDGFLLHASAVELDGKAFAFSAPSGTGKSTHAAFWEYELGAQIINDDKPALRLIDGRFCACGTPFSGKHDKSRNVCVPLKAIVFLKRGPSVTVRRLPVAEALYAILTQTLRPQDVHSVDSLFPLYDRLLKQVAVYEATVPNDPSAAHDVYKEIV